MFLENASRKGWIEVICGSMFSGKTEELIRRLKRARYANQKVEIFKPRIDMAAISSATPARMSGEVMRVARRRMRWSWPMTVARCGSQRMICAPMSISLSTKNKTETRLRNTIGNLCFWKMPAARAGSK